MLWKPNYTITNKLLLTIRLIGESVGEIKHLTLSTATLALLEIQARELSSFASTSIEGNPLPLTDVKFLLKNKPQYIRDTEREILNYNKALKMMYGTILDSRFCFGIRTLENIQNIVVDGLMNNPSDIGKLRQKPVVIRSPSNLNNIVFVPPNYKDVPTLLQRMFSFINTNIGVIDPIILAGIFHKQCVIIHPFMDGNGRSTRIMTTSLLGISGLDLFKIFSFESYYNQNISKYFQKVGLQGDYYDLQNKVDFTNWLEYFADGILDELRRVIKLLPQTIQPRLENFHRLILDYIAKHGSITQRECSQLSNRSLSARKNDFQKLLDLKLIEQKDKGRNVYYILPT